MEIIAYVQDWLIQQKSDVRKKPFCFILNDLLTLVLKLMRLYFE
jgi:hypothetical protein